MKLISFLSFILFGTSSFAQLDTLKVDNSDFSVYEKCKPCYLILTENNNITIEGKRYSDCAYGTLKYYYPNGVIKEVDTYKDYEGNDWRTPNSPCSLRDGVRIFYNELGEETKREVWENGVLISK